jgi:uncharacterized protein
MPRSSANPNPNVGKPTQGDLPDVNVWLALLNAQHVHHQIAKLYWEEAGSLRTMFCRTTMLGLLRLSTNKVVMNGTPYTAEQAWQAYQSVIDLPEVALVAEPPGIETAMRKITSSAQFRNADWTDAYLAAFAQSANLRLVSFDKGFAQHSDLVLLTL